MQLGLVYLGIILLIGACYLYMRYAIKQQNTKIMGILELTNTLAQEMEEINRVSNFLGKARGEDVNSNNETRNDISLGENVDYNELGLQIISDDEDDDDDDEDDEDEDDDEDDVNKNVGVVELIEEDNNIDNTKEIEMDDMKPSIIEGDIDSLIIEGMLNDKTEIDKMTVSALKLKIKEMDPSIKLTNLKRNELVNILKNE